MATITQRSFKYQFLFLAFAVGFAACKPQASEEGQTVARVYDDVLTDMELMAKMPAAFAADDSAKIADQVINNWIREKSVLNFAERNLSESQKDFSKQLEDYQNSLIVYAYERELINQKLDTNVSQAETKLYYDKHIENFKLNTYILKLRFLKLSKDAPKQAKLEKWFTGDDEKDFDKLYDYCKKYCENYFLEENTWLYLQDVLKEVPVPVNDWDNFLRKTTYYKFETNSFQYLVRIFDYKLKDDTSPYTLERAKVRDLILNKRKVELINKMRDDVVIESYDNKKIQLVKSEK